MSHKIKSLIYLICFVVSSVLYYNMEQGFNTLSNTGSTVIAKVDTNKTQVQIKAEAAEVQ